MAGIRRHAEADNLSQGRGSAGQRPLQRLQNQHGGAFAQNHAGAILRKRDGRYPG